MPIRVQVFNSQDEVIERFESHSDLAKHVGIGVHRLNTFLKGRIDLSIKELNELFEVARTPRNWDHAGKNRKKK